MPLYEYECDKCLLNFEITQSIHDEPLKECPAGDCSGKPRRIISKPVIELKGSCWFKDGYNK